MAKGKPVHSFGATDGLSVNSCRLYQGKDAIHPLCGNSDWRTMHRIWPINNRKVEWTYTRKFIPTGIKFRNKTCIIFCGFIPCKSIMQQLAATGKFDLTAYKFTILDLGIIPLPEPINAVLSLSKLQPVKRPAELPIRIE
jgi:hypothetical protein